MVSTTAAPRPRTREDKLFQTCLDVCTESLQQFAVTQREATPATYHDKRSAALQQLPTLSPSPSPLTSLPSPPSSPRKPASSATQSPDSAMNRVPPHGFPQQGDPSPSFGTQDARGSSNLAVQPAASQPGGISLKKSSVKIASRPARSAGPARAAPTISKTPAPPVKAAENVHEAPKPTVSATSTPTAKVEPSATPQKTAAKEAALEELWLRLNSVSALSTPTANTSSPHLSTTAPAVRTPTNSTSVLTPEAQVQQPISPGGLVAIKEEPAEDVQTPPTVDSPALGEPEERTVGGATSVESENVSPQDAERVYLQKASEYLTSIPSNVGHTGNLVKNVITKLRRPYAPSAVLEPDVVAELKARYLDALFTLLESINDGKKSVTKDQIEEILVKGNGDFLHLCAVLAEQKLLAIENLDQVAALCKAIEDVLPNDQDTASSTSCPNSQAPTSKDPLDGMNSWPAREKRESGPECRTCYLKGFSGIDSINKLQALVWGGRVESLQLPQPGSGNAIVRFLTPEACQKYFAATENGITVPDSKAVIFVEKAAGPNSVNDVMRNCAEGDASRCIRAYDADQGWGDMLLMKLARGKGQSKREVDRIKRGTTARGRFFIEFRFANIYSALQFKRQLMDDEDWEHCNIVYAPDPCETAQGVHKDEDENEKTGAFF